MDTAKKFKKLKPDLLVIGWMEHLDLPDLQLLRVKAKIDTGARTTALHATHIEPFMQGGAEWVRFQVQHSENAPLIWISAPIHDRRDIKNTSGIPEQRIVIRTTLKLTDRTWPISVSLTDRSNMRFQIIVGRSALKNHNIAVHTRRANLTHA
ncbi:ATP-dependent zinc protease family protein [Yoonia sp. MH D7]